MYHPVDDISANIFERFYNVRFIYLVIPFGRSMLTDLFTFRHPISTSTRSSYSYGYSHHNPRGLVCGIPQEVRLHGKSAQGSATLNAWPASVLDSSILRAGNGRFRSILNRRPRLVPVVHGFSLTMAVLSSPSLKWLVKGLDRDSVPTMASINQGYVTGIPPFYSLRPIRHVTLCHLSSYILVQGPKSARVMVPNSLYDVKVP